METGTMRLCDRTDSNEETNQTCFFSRDLGNY